MNKLFIQKMKCLKKQNEVFKKTSDIKNINSKIK
jgi:hypothetical protein